MTNEPLAQILNIAQHLDITAARVDTPRAISFNLSTFANRLRESALALRSQHEQSAEPVHVRA